MARRRRPFRSETMATDSAIWLRYQATTALWPLFEQAAQKALTAAVMYLGSEYQKAVPSRRVASSVGYKVRPPRAYVGPAHFVANFLEVGSQPHAFMARGSRLKTRMSRKAGTNTIVKRKGGGFQYQKGRRYMAIPTGGGVIFRTRVSHPGMRGGQYMRRTGEQGVAVVEQIMAKAFKGVFS